MALSLTPLLIFLLVAWTPLTLLTALGSTRRGEPLVRAGLYGFAFPVTWVLWLAEDNHREGRTAFRSR